MKNKWISAVLSGFLLFAGEVWAAEEKAAAPKDQLKQLVDKIQEQLKAGKKTEKDLEPLIKEFDVLLDQHKGEKTDDVAQILIMKAMLYVQVFDETEKGLAMLEQLKKDFPETRPGKAADQTIDSIKQQEAGKAIQRKLVAGSVFPDFTEKDLSGKPLSISNFKGKIVLVDFWATWCGPCVQELPNVLKTYEKYHDKGLEIIGISLDREEPALKKFIEEKGMKWAQFFDGKGWQNKLAAQYGVQSIPATYLLDGEGKILAKDLRGEDLEKEIAKHIK
jgi:thiol-disulfide isomerase/thioredoxin